MTCVLTWVMFKLLSYTSEKIINLSSKAIDGVIRELMVPFLFTKGVLSGERFECLATIS